ncbi:MAG: histidine kinase [Chitinophagaceae bacterium]|nr:MAG: histidine kinase [Chitinophagaceae bacterium]
MPDARVINFFQRKIVYHTVFWLIYFVGYFSVIVYGLYRVTDPWFYIQSLPLVVLDLVMVYFNFNILIPKYLANGRYIIYGLLLFVAMVTAAVLNITARSMYANAGYEIFASLPLNFASFVATIAERFYLIGLTTSIKITKDWLLGRQLIKDKEKQFLETELNFLKSQIQPHFFFNTLNNLYSLTLQKSDKAPEVVLKLSELMSYMLYESNTSTVGLTEEINYLRNYIDLEKLRFGSRLTIDFEVYGDATGLRIPPLLLILFVENSFKHGVRNNIGKTEIKAYLKIETDSILFKIENPVSVSDVPGSGGIGLKNVKRRLELLYGDKYKLDTIAEKSKYTALLKLPI